jgi:hypothetical protein
MAGCGWTEAKVELHPLCFAACQGLATDAQIADHEQIEAQMRGTYEDLEAAGSLLFGAAPSLTSLLSALIKGNEPRPAGFSHEGQGVYLATPTTDSRLELRYHLATDTSFGHKGDPIGFDVFDASNYFQGVTFHVKTKVSTSGISESVQAEFTKAGPGAELLGLGPAPSSPVTIDLPAFSAALGAIGLGANVTLHHQDGPTLIDYAAHTTPFPIVTLSGSTRVDLLFDQFTGSRTDTGQTLKSLSSSLSFVQGGAALDGSQLFASTSAAFSFHFLYHFPSSTLPDIAFGCPQSTLTLP